MSTGGLSCSFAFNGTTVFLFRNFVSFKEKTFALSSLAFEPCPNFVRRGSSSLVQLIYCLTDCRRGDLNPHSSRHMHLKHACLPFHHIDLACLFSFQISDLFLCLSGGSCLKDNPSRKMIFNHFTSAEYHIDLACLFSFQTLTLNVIINIFVQATYFLVKSLK